VKGKKGEAEKVWRDSLRDNPGKRRAAEGHQEIPALRRIGASFLSSIHDRFGLAVVAGCAIPGAPQALPASNAGIDRFSLTGRVAVKLEQRGYSAKLNWRHAAGGDRLRLLSPVGSVIAELEADASVRC